MDSASHPNPDPYLKWELPYLRENIAFSLRRLELSDRVKIMCMKTPKSDFKLDKRSVFIVEAPEGAWGVWVCSENTLQCALCCGDSPGVREAQIERVYGAVSGASDRRLKHLKVPSCEVDHSGPASVCNARWLAPARRRGHPTGAAYMEIRDLDTQAWHNMGQ
tara:strand:- start:4330 stop:4818 length:489 start_codon:yes stop_codon:yes gene_type:complete